MKDVVKAFSRKAGFTLIELLVVIAIAGILAGLAVPAIKNLGKSNITLSASRQLLDDVGHARQLAMANHTTVYMVFVPTNFWVIGNSFPNTWWNNLTPAQRNAATNLADKQLTGYTFLAYGALGDQPGKHQWHYLEPWQNLPEGSFISFQKFNESTNQFFWAPNPADPVSGAQYPIYGFATNTVPFPSETNANFIPMPCIAFNYLGQLVSDVDASGNYRDAYIPLAKGSVSPALNPRTKTYVLNPPPNVPPQVLENPPGNSTNSSYNIIHIDALTGRATLEFQKVQ